MTQYQRIITAQAKIFKALGHPSRLLMVDALRTGEKCVCELQELVGADMSTISRHLGILREAAIITSEKRGTNIYYQLKLPCITNFLACTARVVENVAREQIDLLAK